MTNEEYEIFAKELNSDMKKAMYTMFKIGGALCTVFILSFELFMQSHILGLVGFIITLANFRFLVGYDYIFIYTKGTRMLYVDLIYSVIAIAILLIQ